MSTRRLHRLYYPVIQTSLSFAMANCGSACPLIERALMDHMIHSLAVFHPVTYNVPSTTFLSPSWNHVDTIRTAFQCCHLLSYGRTLLDKPVGQEREGKTEMATNIISVQLTYLPAAEEEGNSYTTTTKSSYSFTIYHFFPRKKHIVNISTV